MRQGFFNLRFAGLANGWWSGWRDVFRARDDADETGGNSPVLRGWWIVPGLVLGGYLWWQILRGVLWLLSLLPFAG